MERSMSMSIRQTYGGWQDHPIDSDRLSFPWPRTEARRAKGAAMPSAVIKRSIVLVGHKTSVSLEDPFWAGLKDIAQDSGSTLSNLVNKVDTERVNANLSSALRVYVFQHFRRGQPTRLAQLDREE
jgi:predicted DNA-binding ribbon-helix-helix protein